MSGIYGTRDVPPRLSSRSKSSPDGDLAALNGSNSQIENKSKAKIDPAIHQGPKIPYISGVVIERTRTRSGDSEHSCNGEREEITDGWKKKGFVSAYPSQPSPSNSATSIGEEFVLEKEVMERNYTSLMQQLATVLVEKETLVYQVQLLGQAYGELKTQLTSLAERDNDHPSRLECLRDERHRLADYIIALTSAELKIKVEPLASSMTALRTQRDLWRNKFLASSLIVDELSNQRLFLLGQFEEAQQTVIGLIEEKEAIRKGLFDVFGYLQETKETLDPLDHGKYRHLAMSHTVNALMEADQELAKGLHRKLLNTTRAPSARGFFADDGSGEAAEPVVVPSEVEKQAKKVLEIDVKAFAASNPCEDFQRLINERAHGAGLPPPKMHNIVVNCCRRCEGQIKIV